MTPRIPTNLGQLLAAQRVSPTLQVFTDEATSDHTQHQGISMTDAARCKRVAQRAITGLTTVEGFDVYAYLKMELETVPWSERTDYLRSLFVAATYLHASTMGGQRLIREILSDPDHRAENTRQPNSSQ
jgi:hypothetical protein